VPSTAPGVSFRFPRRRRDVLLSLTEADLRARYGRGGGRFAKWLLDPFALAGVYLLLVTFVLDRGGPAPGLSLACAILPFQLVMSTVTNSMIAITTRRSIVLNMSFQRLLIPVATTLTETVAFIAGLSLPAMMMIIYGVSPTWALLVLPLVILVTVFFAGAVAYPASIFGLWFRDLRQFAISFVRTLFFLAPGLIALNQVGGTAARLLRLNPFTGLFEAYRDVILYGRIPAAWELLYPTGIAVVLLAVFLPIYRSEQRQFAKVVE
jgi:lipopolysaccharide transport system permease protein